MIRWIKMKPDNTLTLGYLSKHPDNAARLLERLPYSMTCDLFARLSPEQYLSTFHSLLPSYAAGILDVMEDLPRGKLVEALSNERLSVILAILSDDKKKNILTQLSSEKRKKVVSQMKYPRDTVGSIMEPPKFSLPADISVAEALKRIKAVKHYNFTAIIVVDSSLHYLGLVTLDKLIQASPDTRLSSIVNYKIPAQHARKSLQNLNKDLSWSYVRILAVTDVRGLLIGCLSYATLLEHTTMGVSTLKPEPAQHVTTLELFMNTLASFMEALAQKLFASDKKYNKE